MTPEQSGPEDPELADEIRRAGASVAASLNAPEAEPRRGFLGGLVARLAPSEGRGRSGSTDLERELLGGMADPANRRAVEDLAGRIRRPIDAGATEASRHAEGRIPEVGGEVVHHDAPASILRVIAPGDPMSPLDLLQYRGDQPEVFAAVLHDRDNGWHWLGEPPPPEPGPDDRIRAAITSGRAVPKVGQVVRLQRRKPRSYRGVEVVGLQARVVAVVDVVGPTITLDLEVLDEPPDGLDPADASGTIAGVTGPVAADKEGWSLDGWPARFLHIDMRKWGDEPCHTCGRAMHHLEWVEFMSRTHQDFTHPLVFARLCKGCADRFGRLAFGTADPGSHLL